MRPDTFFLFCLGSGFLKCITETTFVIYIRSQCTFILWQVKSFHGETNYPISKVQTNSSQSERGQRGKAQRAFQRKLHARLHFILNRKVEWNEKWS